MRLIKSCADLCVLQSVDDKKWRVVSCGGGPTQTIIAECDTREAALAAAKAEQQKLIRQYNKEVTVHTKEDCPCFCNFPPPL